MSPKVLVRPLRLTADEASYWEEDVELFDELWFKISPSQLAEVPSSPGELPPKILNVL